MGFPATGNPRENFAKSPLTITTGIISKVPAAGDKESEIELDCRVNPGNSGGPLFNDRGAVVGMIRARASRWPDRDSFGLAIPAEKLVAFLKKNLPASAVLVAPKNRPPNRSVAAVEGADGAVRRMRAQLPVDCKHPAVLAPREQDGNRWNDADYLPLSIVRRELPGRPTVCRPEDQVPQVFRRNRRHGRSGGAEGVLAPAPRRPRAGPSR